MLLQNLRTPPRPSTSCLIPLTLKCWVSLWRGFRSGWHCDLPRSRRCSIGAAMTRSYKFFAFCAILATISVRLFAFRAKQPRTPSCAYSEPIPSSKCLDDVNRESCIRKETNRPLAPLLIGNFNDRFSRPSLQFRSAANSTGGSLLSAAISNDVPEAVEYILSKFTPEEILASTGALLSPCFA